MFRSGASTSHAGSSLTCPQSLPAAVLLGQPTGPTRPNCAGNSFDSSMTWTKPPAVANSTEKYGNPLVVSAKLLE